MKSREFTNEGNDRTVADVKDNHPEIYDFFKKTGSWMTFDRNTRKVDSYDTDNSHMVVITMGPSAGMGNTEASIKAAGLGYESMTNPMGGPVLSGNVGEMYWSVKDDAKSGNITETWRFTFPRTDIEETSMQATTGVLGELIKKAGYGPQIKEHFPRHEGQEALVNRLEDLISNAGYERRKSSDGTYSFEYDVDGSKIVFNYRDADTGLSGWYADNNLEEGDMLEEVDEGEPRIEKLDLHSAFGSDAANALRQEGIKFYEKPSYWSDLDRKAMSPDTLRTAEFALEEAGMDLPEYNAEEIYPVNTGRRGSYVQGPLQSVTQMPNEKVFVIHDLPYSDERRGVTEPKVGTFLVDTQGAETYIRSWIMIK